MTDQRPEPSSPQRPGPDAEAARRRRSLSSEAWRELRRNPDVISMVPMIAVFMLMSVFPSLFHEHGTRPRHSS